MKNPYIRLIIRASAVLLVVVLLSRVHYGDERVIAGEYATLLVSDAKVGTGLKLFDPGAVPGQVIRVADAEYNADPVIREDLTGITDVIKAGDEGCDVPEEAIPENTDSEDISVTEGTEPVTPDTGNEGEISDIAEMIGEEEGSLNGENEEPEDIIPAENYEPDSEIVSLDANDPALYAGLSELEAAELHASLDSEYRNTKEYINALLVTDPEHYNETMVAAAAAIPLDSNDARYEFITGKGFKAYTVGNMPSGFKSDAQARGQMTTFDVPVWKLNSKGNYYSSVLSFTINSKLEASIRCIFSDIYRLETHFPFKYLKGYNYRKVGGSGLVASKLMSTHAFGVALDINNGQYDNDLFIGKGSDLRDKSNPYCIPDSVIEIFANYGWYWGGNYEICCDSMHFQYFGLDFLKFDNPDEPFPILYRGAEEMNSDYIRNLSQRLVRLGYLEKETSVFSRKLDKALKAYQENRGLEADGIADYETWQPLINDTHDMSYVF